MRKFKYGVGVIASNFLLNFLLVKMSQKSLMKSDFWSKKQKDTSDDGKPKMIFTLAMSEYVNIIHYYISRTTTIAKAVISFGSAAEKIIQCVPL